MAFIRTLSQLHPLTLLAAFLPPVLVRLVFQVISIFNPAFPTHSLAGSAIYVACLWLVISLGWICLHGRGVTWQNLGFVSFRWGDLLWAGAAALAGFALFYVSQSLADWLRLPAYQGIAFQPGRAVDLVIAMLVCVLIGPLGEEILYRGFLLGWLWGWLGNPWLAGLLSTLIFAMVHVPGFGLRGSLYILIWTPLVVALFISRRSIYPGYEAHLVNNFVAYVLVPVLLAYSMNIHLGGISGLLGWQVAEEWFEKTCILLLWRGI
jgi:membrane protease YdiL (CAAX protease family)